MKRKRFIIPAAGCLIAAAALILSPAEAVSAGRDGVTLCLETVIPSLFPFFVVGIVPIFANDNYTLTLKSLYP